MTVARTAGATADAGCDNAAMVALVARFLDAYNAGAGARLLAFFPARDATRGIGIAGEETYFQRYWDVRKPRGRDGSGFEAYARADLPPYWALRHAQHERLQLLEVEGGGAGRFGLAGIGFMLTRQADDLPAHTVVGKAAIDCGQGTFTVWSMGPQDQPAATPISAATATRGVSSVAQATTTRSGTASAAATNRPDGATYPVGCTPAEVEAFLERFLDAFNQGDAAALRTFFPTVATGRGVVDYTGEKFVWYSMTDQQADGSKRHFVAYDLPALWAYFAERHAHQETLRLASITAIQQQDPRIANMSLQFYRTADDVPPDAGLPPGQATGKAVMNCRDQTLLVVSLGQGRDATGAFASLWDWGHFRPIARTRARPASAFMGRRRNIAPETASRSAPGLVLYGIRTHDVGLRLNAAQGWDSGS